MADLSLGFSALAVVLAGLLVLGVFAAWRRTGAPTSQAARAALVMAFGLLVWMTLSYQAADRGLLRFTGRPPTMPIMFLLMLALAIGVGVSAVGRRLAMGLPLAVLVGVQGFRLPLELMMHRAYSIGLMPVQMSYSGRNFDILTGILAIVVAVLLATKRAGIRAVRFWNVVGTVLLLNVLAIAWLSVPTPFQVFRNPPGNDWITNPPWIWLPAVMVAVAILGHIVVYRRLRVEAASSSPPVRSTLGAHA